MKARGLPSPDDGDALTCTFAEPVMPRAVPGYLDVGRYGGGTRDAEGGLYSELER